MACTIVSNNIPVPETREAVSAAIRAGIGEREGDWTVVVYQAEDYPGLAVRIAGPREMRFGWTFFGKEQMPEFIRERTASSIAGRLSLQETINLGWAKNEGKVPDAY